MMNHAKAPTLVKAALAAAAAFAMVVYLLPARLFPYWDFQNNLWGPAYLLLNGKSPYLVTQLFLYGNAIWLPQIIGLLFPLGWLGLELAGRIWFSLTLLAIYLIVFLCYRPARLTSLKLAAALLLVFLFPSIVLHFNLGQISLHIILLFILALRALKGKRYLWGGLLCVLALTKPQLGLLVMPGLLVYVWRGGGISGLLKLGGAMLAWFALLLLPLFAGYPDWISGFIAAQKFNKDWAHPSLLTLLQRFLGQMGGAVVWLAAALAVFGINIRLWQKSPPQTALVWSLALTCLASPYIWSWDFVLLLPCFLHLLGRVRGWRGYALLAVGFAAGALLAWSMRWGARVSDEVFVWVPAYMVGLFLLARAFWLDKTAPAG